MSEYKVCAGLIFFFFLRFPKNIWFLDLLAPGKMCKFVSSCLKFGNSSHNMWQWTVSSPGDSSASAFKQAWLLSHLIWTVIIISAWPNSAVQWVALLLCIQGILASNLVYGAGYPDTFCMIILIPSVCLKLMPLPDSAISFPVNYLLTDLWFDRNV